MSSLFLGVFLGELITDGECQELPRSELTFDEIIYNHHC